VRAELVAAGRRTGVVAPATVDAARRRLRAVEAGADLGSALAREVDEESAYRTWIEETVAPARDALVRLQLDRLPGGRVALLRRRPVRAAAALAALFVLAAVGLSLWVAALRREVERLSRPSIGVSFETISFGETTRGPAERPAVPNASFVVLYVTLGIDVPPYDRYRLELADAEATRLWISPPFAARPYAEIPVVVPGRLLPLAGDLRLRLYGVTAAEPRLIEERVVAVRPPGP
jgi:hypothetical protein